MDVNELTDKERLIRGQDALGNSLFPVVDDRMCQQMAGGEWQQIYLDLQQEKGRSPDIDVRDPRELIRIIRTARQVFPEIGSEHRFQIGQIAEALNEAAHSTQVDFHSVNNALEFMVGIAELFELPACAKELESLMASEITADKEQSVPENAPTVVELVDTASAESLLGQSSVNIGSCRIDFSFQRILNYSLVHNKIAPIRTLSVTNIGSEMLASVDVSFSISNFGNQTPSVTRKSPRLSASDIDPHISVEATSRSLEWEFDPAPFLTISDPMNVELRICATINGEEHIFAQSIEIHPANTWWAGISYESLASFAQPNNSTIDGFLADVSRRLEKDTQDSSLQGYQAGPKRVQEIAKAIYDEMASKQIIYREPPISFLNGAQRIRTHSEVLDEHQGTCLDLATTFAAALEGAGISPVVVLTKNHAFCGYLNDDVQLPETVADRSNGIDTISKSDLIEYVETTALCGATPADFVQATGMAAARVDSAVDGPEQVIDIKSAQRTFRPLPSLHAENGSFVTEVVKEVPVARSGTRRVDAPLAAPNQSSNVPPRVLKWQQSLLDMSFRNPLLRLKASSSAAIVIPSGTLADLEDDLEQDTSFELFPEEHLISLHPSVVVQTTSEVEVVARELREAHRLFVKDSPARTKRVLQELARKARTSKEETGADNLYLSVGTLEWAEGTRVGHAPIFLIPVRLTRGRGTQPPVLSRDRTRDVEPNYCLHEKLSKTFGIEVPELINPGLDDSGINVEGALRKIRSRLLEAHSQQFTVNENATLATFQFSTLGMWRDIRDNWETFCNKPSVKHLVYDHDQAFQQPELAQLDDSVDEAAIFAPIPADASQLQAVNWATQGKTFVLQGPPGTGKSQTITNLIANSLAQGKKVLFVAEKQAALQVVQDRLDEIGLSPFCLDLHGDKQTNKAVRDKIMMALDASFDPTSSWEHAHGTYRSQVLNLSHYPLQLHEEGPAGSTAWQSRQTMLRLGQRSDYHNVQVSIPRSVVMDAQKRQRFFDSIIELNIAIGTFSGAPQKSPWSDVSILDALDSDITKRLRAALKQISDLTNLPNWDGLRPLLELGTDTEKQTAILDWLEAFDADLSQSPQDAVAASQSWIPAVRQILDRALSLLEQWRVLLGNVNPSILNIDLKSSVDEFSKSQKKLFGKSKASKTFLAQFVQYFFNPQFATSDNISRILSDVIQVQTLNWQLQEDLRRVLPQDLGWRIDLWDAETLDNIQMQLLGWQVSAQLGQIPQASQIVQDGLSTGALSRPLKSSANLYFQVANQLRNLLQLHFAADSPHFLNRDFPDFLVDALPSWQSDADRDFQALRRWVSLQRALQPFDLLGINSVRGMVLSGSLNQLNLESSLRLAYEEAVLEERLDTTDLVAFDSKFRGKLTEQYIESTEQIRQELRQKIPATIIENRTFDSNSSVGLVGNLRTQLNARRNAMSVRKLIENFSSLLTQITPCFLMSPTSVAKFLPANSINFDIVVFDEASQIRVPEAIGAMGRAESVVIVGDSKQMPPSSTFAASGSNQDDDENPDNGEMPIPADMESILSEAVQSTFPALMLTWHYRSRDESLISFSNSRYYDDNLASFPMPPDKAENAVKFVKVDGTWEGGGSGRAARVNRVEAERIVTEIQKIIAEQPERSIGVVTFNIQQRNLILDLLEQASDSDPDLFAAMSREDNPVFVKNLENVQGDERDIILFSLAFAKAANGRIPLNWGPLTRSGGEKRLNVAVTRAKEEVVLFCSFEPHELDLSGSTSQGMRDLKDYLLFAKGQQVDTTNGRKRAIDLHQQEIAGKLREAGLEVVENVGMSDFSVELAVRKPGLPWVAIMLDGPEWHERGSVGDREAMPKTILEGRMGWAGVQRVWFPDWIRDANEEVARLVAIADSMASTGTKESNSQILGAKLPEPLEQEPEHPQMQGMGRQADPTSPVVATVSSADLPVAENLPSVDTLQNSDWVPIAQAINKVKDPGGSFQVDFPVNNENLEFEAASVEQRYESEVLDGSPVVARQALTEQIREIVEVEGPVEIDRLILMIGKRFGFSRVQGSRRDQVKAAIPYGWLQDDTTGPKFVWDNPMEEFGTAKFRTQGNDRKIAEIPYQEILNAMFSIVSGAWSISRDDLIKETSKLFGNARMGKQIKERLTLVIDKAVEEGIFVDDDGSISCPTS